MHEIRAPGAVIPSGYDLSLALESVGAGWAPLIHELFEKLPDGVLVQQVKEKFGALRVYTNHANDEVRALLGDLERRSATMCERCGQLGEIKAWRGYWLRCLCPTHGEEVRNATT